MKNIFRNVYRIKGGGTRIFVGDPPFASRKKALEKRFVDIDSDYEYVGTIELDVQTMVKEKDNTIIHHTDLESISDYLHDLHNIINSLPNSMTISKQEKNKLKTLSDMVFQKCRDLAPKDYF